MSMSPCDSLPPELLAKILNQLPFEDRKNGRLVSKNWRETIDTHSNVKFRVELNDRTAKWMENLTFPQIEHLRIRSLSTPLDSLNLFPKKIKTLSISAFNTSENFWEALSSCHQNEVECLELESCYGNRGDTGDLCRHPRAPDFPSSTALKSVKKLTLKVRKRDGNSFKKDRMFLTRGWGLVLSVLKFPSIESISFELDYFNLAFPSCLSLYVYPLLNMNTGIKSLTLTVGEYGGGGFPVYTRIPLKSPLTNLKLEKLDLHVDFQLAADLTPLIKMENQQLKQLRIKHTNLDVVASTTQRDFDTLTELIHRNSSSLEFLSIRSMGVIDLAQLQLENCRALRTLKLNAPTIIVPEQMPRISHIKSFKFVGVGSACNVLTGVGKQILEIFGQDLEEYTLDFYNQFWILDLEKLLRLPKIKKIVLTRVRDLDPTITDYCNNFQGIRTILVAHDSLVRPGRGSDYHITIT